MEIDAFEPSCGLWCRDTEEGTGFGWALFGRRQEVLVGRSSESCVVLNLTDPRRELNRPNRLSRVVERNRGSELADPRRGLFEG